MTTSAISQTIKNALNILNAQDWYYSMADCGYLNAQKSAKATMRLYVETTNTLPADLRDTMRNLWIATCEYMKLFRPFNSPTADEKRAYETAKAEAMAIINPIIA